MTVFVPTTLDAALQALAHAPDTPDAPDTVVLAGGTDLMVEFNGGQRRADRVVVVNRVPELCTWRHDPREGTLRIGAGITYAEIETDPIATWVPALAQAARTVGSPQIRHAATIGGNVGTCSPAGDGLPVLAALGAAVELASAAGVRSVPFGEFMTGPKRTVRRPEELITAITVPVVEGYQGYSKVGVRNAMVIAVASAALVVSTPARSVALALGSVGPVILRCPEVEELAAQHADFDARRLAPDVVDRCRELAMQAARPIDDHRSSAAYRRHAIGVLTGRLLRRAFPHD
jgi:CO/xanthine dehydrogenase FAD-binding subunit